MKESDLTPQQKWNLGGLLTAFMASWLCAAHVASAQDADPPSRIARIALAQGSVSFEPAGTLDWVAAPLNRPLTTGDTLWVDNASRVELQLDGSAVRLGDSSQLTLINLTDDVTQLQLNAGTLILRVRRLEDNETYEIDTPNLAFSVLRPGTYRISVDPSGNSTSIVVRNGQGEVSGGDTAYTIQSGDYDVFTGSYPLSAEAQPQVPDPDAFDAWSAARDSRWDRSASARYVSDDVVGYQDLDEQGSWNESPDYGPVWYPNDVPDGWAPYQAGYWAYIAPWGYTWVDAQPWGFACFHYGRWVWGGRAWGWIPTPPRPNHGLYIRPVYSPALVAWVGAGAGVAWVALGPHEVYVPSYPVSARYVRNINVSNTTVNTTVINNVYNTTIINHKTVNIPYVNRSAPGAVIATTTAAFSTAQPVSRNQVRIDPHALATASIRPIGPAIVPSRQAVIGASRALAMRPPQPVLTRTVVARATPPPPPPSFEARQTAIRANGGRPLSLTQVSEIQRAAPAARPAPIRVASRLSEPVRVAPPARPNAPPPPMARPQPPERPVTQIRLSQAAPAAVHARELPRPPPAPSPGVADSALEREQLQQQQQLRAEQEREQQRIQQQQELEHQRLGQAQADAARNQELERQHQQQTQQLQQRQIAEQQALAAKQHEEARAEAPPPRQQQPAPPPPPRQQPPPPPPPAAHNKEPEPRKTP